MALAGGHKRDSVQVVHLVEMAAARLTGSEKRKALKLARHLHDAVIENNAQLKRHTRTRIGLWAEKVLDGRTTKAINANPTYVRKVRCKSCRREADENVMSHGGRALGPALYCVNCGPKAKPRAYRGGDSMYGLGSFKDTANTGIGIFGLAALGTLAFVLLNRGKA